MKRILSIPIALSLAAALLALATADMALASPHYGGDCHYCHGGDQPDAMTIAGESAVIDDKKVFDVDPGGTVQFGLNVTNPGMPSFYRVVLRGLDRLNGVDPENGTPHYFPRLYTPDPGWLSEQGPAPGQQYLFWEGQFYGTNFTFGQADFDYQLTVGQDVAPGLYDLTAYVAGGAPARAPGQTPSGGWSYGEDFQLRVVPEPGSLALMALGLSGVCVFAWRRRKRTA